MTPHPWITFSLDLQRLPWQSWVRLGECVAKCEQMKTVPLKPHVSEQLHRVYLAKGVHATTAIEGNTLSEEQVLASLDSKLELPPSKQYLEQEVENVIEACNEISEQITQGQLDAISPESLCHYNDKVLQKGIPHDEAAIPGQLRQHNVVVGNVYRAPDAKDVAALTEQFCLWMNGPAFRNNNMAPHFAILKAITAHLYIAWIHPFGDGNGRVARLLEFAILLNSGVPSPAAHLLSNHYNLTRSEYYRQLDRASKKDTPIDFFAYAISGFADGLRDQWEFIQQHVITVCWRDYIYEEFATSNLSSTTKRRRELALKIAEQSTPTDRESIHILMRKQYRDRTEKTLARDLNELEKRKLIIRREGKYAANERLILQFLPFSNP